MKLSTRGEYGLRAMLFLAMHSRADGTMLHAQEISEAQDIPPHYLKQILSRLRAAGKARARHFSVGAAGAEFLTLYHRLIAERAERRSSLHEAFR